MSLRGWSRLATNVAGEVVLPAVEQMHRTITDGGFRWTGPLGRPVRSVHDRAVDATYGAIRVGLRAADELVGASAPAGTSGEVSGGALRARAIAHGVVAEELLERVPELDLDLSVHHLARPDASGPFVSGAPADVGADARAQVVVFVHGLVDTERTWTDRGDGRAAALEVVETAGASALVVRYATGRAVGRNGAELARHLDAVLAAWPVPIERLVLVGHSMGGLVVRAACAVGEAERHAWLEALSDVIYLGTPHLGSWLEKVANSTSWLLRTVSPHAAPIARVLDHRSRGIKDLRHGTLSVDDWDPDTIDDLLTGRTVDAPWLAEVTHHLVVGRVRTGPRDPLNLAVGDALVRASSARGQGRTRRIGAGGPVTIVEVDAHHTALVAHPQVAQLIAEVLADDEPG